MVRPSLQLMPPPGETANSTAEPQLLAVVPSYRRTPHITPVRPEIAAVTVPKVSSAQGVTRVRFTAKFRTPSITSCRRALCMPRLLLA